MLKGPGGCGCRGKIRGLEPGWSRAPGRGVGEGWQFLSRRDPRRPIRDSGIQGFATRGIQAFRKRGGEDGVYLLLVTSQAMARGYLLHVPVGPAKGRGLLVTAKHGGEHAS